MGLLQNMNIISKENSLFKSGIFWRESPEFIKEISNYIGSKKVLEIFSGNGNLASVLLNNNIKIKPTTLFSSHDAHDYGLYTEVEEIKASDAIDKYSSQYDILLISWPTVTLDAFIALSKWPKEKAIIYIGEYTDLDNNIFAGCATDELWESASFVSFFGSYKGRYLERAGILKLK